MHQIVSLLLTNKKNHVCIYVHPFQMVQGSCVNNNILCTKYLQLDTSADCTHTHTHTHTHSFIADLRKGVDDFMGRAFYLLGTIPSKGERKSLDLYSHSAKTKMGSVMVDLRIRGMREGLSLEAMLAEHLRLTRAVIDHESKIVSFIFLLLLLLLCVCVCLFDACRHFLFLSLSRACAHTHTHTHTHTHWSVPKLSGENHQRS